MPGFAFYCHPGCSGSWGLVLLVEGRLPPAGWSRVWGVPFWGLSFSVLLQTSQAHASFLPPPREAPGTLSSVLPLLTSVAGWDLPTAFPSWACSSGSFSSCCCFAMFSFSLNLAISPAPNVLPVNPQPTPFSGETFRAQLKFIFITKTSRPFQVSESSLLPISKRFILHMLQ